MVDATGAVLPGAVVTVTATDAPASAPRSLGAPARPASAPHSVGATARQATASDQGLATIGALAPGRYAIKAEFSGFEPGELTDVRLRAGDNKHVVALALTKVEETVTVGRDAQSAAADPNGGSLTTQLTQEEIASFSDDPNELAQQLMDMAGGNAVIKIDSFEGGALPPKAFIKSIRIMRDTFPAENHSAENDGIDIITQAGVGVIRGGMSSRIRGDTFSGKNPFVDVKAPEFTQNFDGNLGGTIVPNKSSFSLFFGGRRQYDTPVATYTSRGRQAVGAARPAPQQRLERAGHGRLRVDQGPNAARAVLAERVVSQQPRHRRVRSRRARLLERLGQPTAADAGGRADRAALVHQHAPAAAMEPQRVDARCSRRRPSACSTA